MNAHLYVAAKIVGVIFVVFGLIVCGYEFVHFAAIVSENGGAFDLKDTEITNQAINIIFPVIFTFVGYLLMRYSKK